MDYVKLQNENPPLTEVKSQESLESLTRHILNSPLKKDHCELFSDAAAQVCLLNFLHISSTKSTIYYENENRSPHILEINVRRKKQNLNSDLCNQEIIIFS